MDERVPDSQVLGKELPSDMFVRRFSTLVAAFAGVAHPAARLA